MQRLKHAEEQQVPDFDDVLARPAGNLKPQPARRLQLVVVCCSAAMLFGAFLFVQSKDDVPTLQSGPVRAEHVEQERQIVSAQNQARQHRVAQIDFDHLHRVVEEYCRPAKPANGVSVSVWSSPTESLLAWNPQVSLTQE